MSPLATFTWLEIRFWTNLGRHLPALALQSGEFEFIERKHNSWKFMYEVLIYLKQLSTLRFAKIFSAAQALPPHRSHKVDPPN